MRALFDTNILIDHLNEVEAAREEILRWPEPAINPITWMEVMAGATDEAQRQLLQRFLACFVLIPIDAAVMDRAARLRQSERMRLPDAIILATAVVHNLTVVTRNTKDFASDRWPNVRVPYAV